MIPVLLAEDETLVRAALATLLDIETDIEVVGHVGSGEELLAEWRRRSAAGTPVAVAVIDLQMPGMDGIETAVELQRLTPGAGTLIVTSHGRPAI